jgi:hypothetical protein
MKNVTFTFFGTKIVCLFRPKFSASYILDAKVLLHSFSHMIILNNW